MHESILLKAWAETIVDAILFERDDGKICVRSVVPIQGVESADIANEDGRIARVIAAKEGVGFTGATAVAIGFADCQPDEVERIEELRQAFLSLEIAEVFNNG